jgi:hypothetical protein
LLNFNGSDFINSKQDEFFSAIANDAPFYTLASNKTETVLEHRLSRNSSGAIIKYWNSDDELNTLLKLRLLHDEIVKAMNESSLR